MNNNPNYECADDIDNLEDLDAVITKRHTIRVMREHFHGPAPLMSSIKEERGPSIVDLNASIASLDDSHSGFFDMAASPRNRRKMELKIVTNELKLVPKSQWKNDSKCYVCERVLDKLKGINPHHCRVCGHGVCGDCSGGRINDHRACDACFRKEKYKGAEKRRQQIIKELTEKEQALKKVLQANSDKVAQAKQGFNEEAEKNEKTENNRNKVAHDRHREIEVMKKTLVKVQEDNVSKIEKVKGQAGIIAEKEGKLHQLKMKLAALKLEISQKSAVLLKKKAKKPKVVQNDKNQFDDTMDSVSSYSGGYSSRNYSLIGNVKDGKFNLSNEPTLI